MEDFTSQGFALCFYPYDKKSDAKRGLIELSAAISVPLEKGPADDRRNFALLRSKIQEAAALDIEVLEALEERLDFQKVERATADALKLWAETVGEADLLRMAMDVKRAARKPDSTNNVWIEDKRDNENCYLSQSISNNCFAATVTISGERKNNDSAGELEWSGPWHVSWELGTNYCQPGLQDYIIKKENGTFHDLDDARLYVEVMIGYLTKKYFYSMDPTIPLELKRFFLIHGVEIPGVNYEKG